MAFNGSGTYVLPANSWNPAVDATTISATDWNSTGTDLATALSTCITKDGQTTVTANLPMAGFRHTGVGDASARTHYAVVGQIQDGKYNWVDGGGTADAITATYAPALTALVDGQLCFVRAGAANTTSTPTFSPNGLTARTIVKSGGAPLVAGDIAADGQELILRYCLADTRWELLNPATPIANPPLFLAKAASSQAVTSAAETKVVFGDIVHNVGGYFAANRFTPLVPGYYQFNAVIYFGGAEITSAYFYFYKNGVPINIGSYHTGTLGTDLITGVPTVIYLDGVDDYVEIFGAVTSVSSAAFAYADSVFTSTFSGFYLRP